MKRLAEFIRENTAPIIDEWERFAHSIHTGAPKMSRDALRDHLPEILTFIARDIGTLQSYEQQKTKSQGGSDKTDSSPDTAAEIHGVLRLEHGFDIKQMISEFRALRASVTKLWIQESEILNKDQLSDLIRFNEAIDQALAESVSRFTRDLDASKDLFLGILGHDIKNPLGAISMSANLLERPTLTQELKGKLVKQIGESAGRIQEIISHLLALTKARLGAKIPLVKQPMNFGETTQKIVAEILAMHPVPDPYWAEYTFCGATPVADIPYRNGIEIGKLRWEDVQKGTRGGKESWPEIGTTDKTLARLGLRIHSFYEQKIGRPRHYTLRLCEKYDQRKI